MKRYLRDDLLELFNNFQFFFGLLGDDSTFVRLELEHAEEVFRCDPLDHGLVYHVDVYDAAVFEENLALAEYLTFLDS